MFQLTGRLSLYLRGVALTGYNRPKLSKAFVKSELRKQQDLTGKYGVTFKLGYVGRSASCGDTNFRRLYRL